MKQYITPEQLDELSNKQKNKLNKWMQKHNYSSYAIVTTMMTTKNNITGYVITPLSIGQMIEFLLHETNFNLDYSDMDGTWGVRLEEKEYGNKELCDALWSAVKEVLNEKLK